MAVGDPQAARGASGGPSWVAAVGWRLGLRSSCVVGVGLVLVVRIQHGSGRRRGPAELELPRVLRVAVGWPAVPWQ